MKIRDLRICTHRQNQCNQSLQSNNISGVAGVSYKKNRKTWNARIKYYGQEIHLGAYHTFIEAVQARNEGIPRHGADESVARPLRHKMDGALAGKAYVRQTDGNHYKRNRTGYEQNRRRYKRQP
jgi:hypothetical protein